MPLTKSAKKALRVDRNKKAINDITRAKVKSALKGARLAISKKESDAKEKIDLAYRELDLAAKKKVIHKNKASRLKSRLAKKFSQSGIENKKSQKLEKTTSKATKTRKTPNKK